MTTGGAAGEIVLVEDSATQAAAVSIQLEEAGFRHEGKDLVVVADVEADRHPVLGKERLEIRVGGAAEHHSGLGEEVVEPAE